jgi:EAL domain-containing protein (putative c-di-GMP-specific phosphodiesterase class I)
MSMLRLTGSLTSLRTEAQWSLVAHDGGDVFPLRGFPCQVGRHPSLGMRIVNPTVSQVHAEFQKHADGLYVTDLGSRNGTFVNGRRIVEPHPLVAGDLVQFGATVFRVQNRSATDLAATCQSDEVSDLALAVAQFEKLISEASIVPVYQPIVEAGRGQTVAFEALARSRLFGLDKPAVMFRAAEFFRMEAELSRLLRRTEIEESDALVQPHLFLNTHPSELSDFKRLVLSLREIRRLRPQQPITLEVHEAAAADLATMQMLRQALRDLNMRLAYDDFGAGQARLQELVEARPDYVKFDRKLITGIERAGSSRHQMLDSLVRMCKQLGIVTLAEGVETAGEAETCGQLGFELLQGYYFGRPDEVPFEPHEANGRDCNLPSDGRTPPGAASPSAELP